MDKKYEVVFIDEAMKDFQKLDGSVKKLVTIAISKMEVRANVLGEQLTSKFGINLVGCRKIKLRKAGIRIVYRIVGERAEIVEIITIGKREDNEVYELAHKRLQELKKESY